VELLEEAAREVVCLDLVLGGGGVERRHGGRRRRGERVLGRDGPELLYPDRRGAGQPADPGAVEHGDPDADDRRARLGPGPTRRRRRPGAPGRVGGPPPQGATGQRRGLSPAAPAIAAVAQRGEGLIDHDDAPDDEGDDDREPERAGGQGEVEAPVGRWLVHVILPQGYRG